MSVDRPTLQQLDARADADLVDNVPDATPTLRRRFLGVIRKVMVGLAHGLYGALQERSPDWTPWSAISGAAIRGWASLWRMSQNAARVASGDVGVLGTAGAFIASGQVLQSRTGAQYSVQADVTLDGAGTGTASLLAMLPGTAGNLAAGEKLTFVSPPVGVSPLATVGTNGIGGGADIEAPLSLKARLIARLGQPPHGGNKFDYVTWAKEIPTVTRAWCFNTYRGAGSVRVYVVNDDYVGSATASAGDVSAVFDHIDPIKPCGVVIDDPAHPGTNINGLEVVAPAKHLVNFTISGVSDAAVRTAMQQAIRDLLRTTAVPEAGVPLTQLIVALGSARGSAGFAMAAPTASPIAGASEILWPGTFTWI